jgi:DNA-binding beta-propeller fold protein YncE
MRVRHLAIVVALVAVSARHVPAEQSAAQAASGQSAVSSEVTADDEALEALAKSVPMLRMDRVELRITPPMTLFGYSAAAADKQGNIYVIHRPSDPSIDPVVVLDKNGRFLRSWGKGMYDIPHSIRIDPAGSVWTVDAHTSLIRKFTPEGKKLLEISVGGIPDPAERFCGATDITFGKSGQIYASDGYCNGRVIEYSADGRKVREWGKSGTGSGEFDVAHDVSLSPDGRLFVADRENGRLQWFDLKGTYIGEKKFGGQLFSVAITAAGDVYVGVHGRRASSERYIMKFDPASGRVSGKLVGGNAHQLSAAPDGTLLPGIRADASSVLLFRPRK